MKRIVLLPLFCLCMTAFSGFAASVTPDKVNPALLQQWVSEKFGTKIDKDGDLVINTDSGKVFVTVNAKGALVRIFSMYAPFKKRSVQEMVDLANKFNSAKRFLRVSIRPNGACVCDCYIVYKGGLDSANFLDALDWFLGSKELWRNTVVKGMDKK